MNKKAKVILTRRWPERVMAEMAEKFDLTAPEKEGILAGHALVRALKACDIFAPSVFDAVQAPLINALPDSTRLIAIYGVGVNQVDLAAAKTRGIVISNTPDVLTEDTADLAIGLMLATLRRFHEGETMVRQGRWQGPSPLGFLGRKLTGKTLGIIGLGRIGLAVAKRARAFDMKLLYHSRSRKPDAEKMFGLNYLDVLSDLFKQADIVSLHCPLTPETRHLIDINALRLMKPSAYLINTGRGELVRETALVAALKDGVIAGAGLDVYEHEPRLSRGLAKLSNATLLPHIGSATLESREAMGFRTLQNIEHFLKTGKPLDIVA